ncbi:hypothetical protein [Maricaulis sp.]|jgi:hypothetical protein|uniref:hypothetical protein n=1 Tax=Maricaulis sp. TaxID=1486257 RepID=UPI0025F2F99C|nr:hypothetical protein [Maricaulis sp.]MDF1768157.1 hypothetical protein [Maricaulis sp.]
MLIQIALGAALLWAPAGQFNSLAADDPAPKPALIKTVQDSFARSLSIVVTIDMGTSIVLDYPELTSGEWQSVPTPGSVINPGDSAIYVAGTQNNFDPLGGALILSVSSGASFSVNFEWTIDGQVTCTVDDTSLQTVSLQVTSFNTMTNSPTCQITAMDANRE